MTNTTPTNNNTTICKETIDQVADALALSVADQTPSAKQAARLVALISCPLMMGLLKLTEQPKLFKEFSDSLLETVTEMSQCCESVCDTTDKTSAPCTPKKNGKPECAEVRECKRAKVECHKEDVEEVAEVAEVAEETQAEEEVKEVSETAKEEAKEKPAEGDDDTEMKEDV